MCDSCQRSVPLQRLQRRGNPPLLFFCANASRRLLPKSQVFNKLDRHATVATAIFGTRPIPTAATPLRIVLELPHRGERANTPKFQERLNKLRQSVTLHEKNIIALKQELGPLK